MTNKPNKKLGNIASNPRVPRTTAHPVRSVESAPRRIFLLSPANAAGIRGKLVLKDNACFSVAMRLRQDGVPLGELFSFISGLYFRGKLAYAQAFAQVPPGVSGAFVITAGRGLVSPDQPIKLAELQEMISVPINVDHSGYRKPLERDARVLSRMAGQGGELVLLGSIATPKYVEPLTAILGERLLFPSEFAGRGDMSRGALMLRCVRSGQQLTYVPVITGERHGPRPAKLPKLASGS
jgi:hypothetical protein